MTDAQPQPQTTNKKKKEKKVISLQDLHKKSSWAEDDDAPISTGNSAPARSDYNDSDRGDRGSDRYGSSDRPRYGDREDRPRYGDREERPRYGDREERPRYGDREERPRYGDREERPRYGDREERPRYGDREERPRYGDREERPRYGDREERPRYGDREERPRYDRPERPELPIPDEPPFMAMFNNLDFNLTVPELEDFLTDKGIKFDRVEMKPSDRGNNNRGFAFVYVPDRDTLVAALDIKDAINGRNLSVRVGSVDKGGFRNDRFGGERGDRADRGDRDGPARADEVSKWERGAGGASSFADRGDRGGFGDHGDRGDRGDRGRYGGFRRNDDRDQDRDGDRPSRGGYGRSRGGRDEDRGAPRRFDRDQDRAPEASSSDSADALPEKLGAIGVIGGSAKPKANPFGDAKPLSTLPVVKDLPEEKKNYSEGKPKGPITGDKERAPRQEGRSKRGGFESHSRREDAAPKAAPASDSPSKNFKTGNAFSVLNASDE